MMTDIIADSLTRIRNAAQRRLDVTTLLHSNAIEATVSIFVDKGYLESYKVKEDGNKKTIKVVLKYTNERKSVISGLKRISKPGLRVYANKEEIPKVLGGLGIAVMSTSNGIMTDKTAREQGVGGEVLAFIW